MKLGVLNLGAGIQSSAIYSLMVDGDIEPADYAVFSDTQEEPSWVHEQLDWCRSLDGPEIVTVTAGKLGEDLRHGKNSTGQRFASIPAHTTYREGEKGGLTRRQCTREYKIEPIEKWIRREVLGLKKGQRLPKEVQITNLFGFSVDEPQRAVRMRAQYKKRGTQWNCEFPLFDEDLLMTRLDCQRYIEEKSGRVWRSSRCVFCPLQSNSHWREIKENNPAGWQRAVQVDEYLRTSGAIANRDMDQSMYVHRSCYPLGTANLDEGQGKLFQDDSGCDQGCFL